MSASETQPVQEYLSGNTEETHRSARVGSLGAFTGGDDMTDEQFTDKMLSMKESSVAPEVDEVNKSYVENPFLTNPDFINFVYGQIDEATNSFGPTVATIGGNKVPAINRQEMATKMVESLIKMACINTAKFLHQQSDQDKGE